MKHRKWGMTAVLMTATAMILLVVTMVVSLSSYASTRRVVQRSYLVNYEQLLEHLNQQLSASISRAVQLTAAMKNNTDLIGEVNLARNAQSASECARHEREVKSILKTAVGYQPYVENAAVYLGETGILLYSIDSTVFFTDIPHEEWFSQIVSGEISEMILPDYQLKKAAFMSGGGSYYKPCFLYARSFNDTRLSGEYGVLLLAFDQAYLSDLLGQMESGDGSIIALLDAEGNSIFASPNTDEETVRKLAEYSRGLESGATLELNGREHFLIRGINHEQPWELAALIPEEVMYNELTQIRETAFAVGACALFVGFVLVLLISRGITRPFRKLMESMARAGEGQLQPSAVRSPIREVNALAVQYDGMVDRIGSLIERNSQIEEEKSLLEMAALKAQINPHFIYNTLDSIRWMALMQKAPQVAQMISSLVKLLKLTTGQKGRYIRVSEEFEQVSHYADIIRFRYNCRINVTFDIEEGLAEARTLGLLLQPIVENSFVHGFSNFERDGNLSIRAYRDGCKLVFIVEDDGCGVLLAEGELPETPKRDGAHLHTGIGVENVNSRIKLSFGDDYGIVFRSVPDVGTTVILTQPLSYFEEGEQR